MKKNTDNESSYFLDEKWITPIKKQHVGICWAYATVAMMEIYVNHKFKNEKKQQFSETNIFYNSFDVRDPKKTDVAINPEGRLPDAKTDNMELKYRGSVKDALAPLAKRRGFVREELDPDPIADGNQNGMPFRENALSIKPNDYYVSKMMLLPKTNVETYVSEIKAMLKLYGAVAVGCYCGDDSGCIYEDKENLKKTVCYYSMTKKNANHMMAIVGWDDDFSKENFKKDMRPQNNGAFKMKNSRGTGTEEDKRDGYAWVSYEDKSFSEAACITEIRKTDPDTQYRVLTSSAMGYRKILSDENCKKVEFKVKFKSDTNQEIKQIGLVVSAGCYATVSSIAVKDNAKTTLIEKCEIGYKGFHVIDLQKDICVWKANQEYEIEVEYTSMGECTHVPVEAKVGYGFDNLKNGKTSFIKKGNEYVDIGTETKPANAVLYLYTTNETIQNNSKQLEKLEKGNIVDNRIDGLERNNVTWAVQPEDVETYSLSLKNNASVYVTDLATGIIKTNDDYLPTYYTAKIGTGADSVMRWFEAEIKPGYPSIEATVSDEKGKFVTISGSFPVPAVTIEVKSNHCDERSVVKADENGKWKIKLFKLFNESDVAKDGTVNSTVDVEIYDNNKLLLGKTRIEISRKLPIEIDVKEVRVGSNKEEDIQLAIDIAVLWGIIEVIIVTAGTIRFTRGLAGGPIRLRAMLGTEVILMLSMSIGYLSGLSNFKIKRIEEQPGKEKQVYVIEELADGGFIEDCEFTLQCEDTESEYGIFKSGCGISVENCKIEVAGNGAKKISLLGETIGKGSLLTDITIHADVKADIVAGVAINAEECILEKICVSGKLGGGTVAGLINNGKSVKIRECECDLQLEGSKINAGIICLANDCTVDACFTKIKFQNSEMVAGIAAQAIGNSSIENCMVNIEDAKWQLGSGKFGGICGEIAGSTIISKCATYSLNPKLRIPMSMAAGICYYQRSVEATISDCYSSLPLVSGTHVGGITGKNYGTVQRCYAASEHIVAAVVGGISLTNVGHVKNCCVADYCFDTIGRRICGGNVQPEDCFAYQKAYMVNAEFMDKDTVLVDEDGFLSEQSYKSMGWDFENDWDLSGKPFPRLKGITQEQYYPFPFLTVTQKAEGDCYTYHKDEKMFLSGYISPRAVFSWNLSTDGVKLSDQMVEGIIVGDTFHVTLGCLDVGQYILTLTCSYGKIKLEKRLYLSIVE